MQAISIRVSAHDMCACGMWLPHIICLLSYSPCNIISAQGCTIFNKFPWPSQDGQTWSLRSESTVLFGNESSWNKTFSSRLDSQEQRQKGRQTIGYSILHKHFSFLGSGSGWTATGISGCSSGNGYTRIEGLTGISAGTKTYEKFWFYFFQLKMEPEFLFKNKSCFNIIVSCDCWIKKLNSNKHDMMFFFIYFLFLIWW